MSKCRVIKQTRPLFCETYNCRGKAAFSIGYPEGPLSKMYNYCEECMEGIAGSIPSALGLEPVTEQLIEVETITEKLVAIYKELDEEEQDQLFNALLEKLGMELEPEEESAAEAEEPAVKKYICEDCGEEFDIPQKYAAHKRFCKSE